MKNRIALIGTSLLLTSGKAFAAAAEAVEAAAAASSLDLIKVFQGSPFIYTTLIVLSILSFVIWLYSLLTLRMSDLMPEEFIEKVREEIQDNRFEAALTTCKHDNNFSARILACGIEARKHGAQVAIEAMQAEGRRSGSTLWQRISLLNDVAIIAPMLGLLGTVLGMFYAFYDTSRSVETITSIFDGLGVAIGTTVAGLSVAILAMIFYTTLKFRMVRLLNSVENEILSLGSLMDLNTQKS